jgi:hypothetical protein
MNVRIAAQYGKLKLDIKVPTEVILLILLMLV